MATVTASALIQAYPKAVFAAFTDFAALARFRGELEKAEVVTPGPVRVGTIIEETWRHPRGPQRVEVEVVAFEPERGYELRSLAFGVEYRTLVNLRPEGGSTRVTMALTTTPLCLRARLRAPLAWLLSGFLKKNLQGELYWMRRQIEREAGLPVI